MMATVGEFESPPVIRRLQRPIRLYELALITLGVLTVWAPGNYLTACICVLLAAALPAELMLTARMRRLHRHVLANPGRLCLNCAYPLQGLRAKSRCPECGTPFNFSDLPDQSQLAGELGIKRRRQR